MKSEKENCLRDEDDGKTGVVTKHGATRVNKHRANCHIWHTKYLQKWLSGGFMWQKVWPSTTGSSLNLLKLPQISSSHLLERIHKSIKLVDVFLIHCQFLRKRVLQIGKTKSSLGNGSLNAHFKKQKACYQVISHWLGTNVQRETS